MEVAGMGDLAYVRGIYTLSVKVPNVDQLLCQEGKLHIYARQNPSVLHFERITPSGAPDTSGGSWWRRRTYDSVVSTNRAGQRA